MRTTLVLAILIVPLLLVAPAAAQTDESDIYLGQLSSNPYDSDSVPNPYGTYGSPYSSASINNP